MLIQLQIRLMSEFVLRMIICCLSGHTKGVMNNFQPISKDYKHFFENQQDKFLINSQLFNISSSCCHMFRMQH